MKAFVRTTYGSPEVLSLAEIDKPVIKDDEVLVYIYATSPNQGDLDYLYGRPFLSVYRTPGSRIIAIMSFVRGLHPAQAPHPASCGTQR